MTLIQDFETTSWVSSGGDWVRSSTWSSEGSFSYEIPADGASSNLIPNNSQPTIPRGSIVQFDVNHGGEYSWVGLYFGKTSFSQSDYWYRLDLFRENVDEFRLRKLGSSSNVTLSSAAWYNSGERTVILDFDSQGDGTIKAELYPLGDTTGTPYRTVSATDTELSGVYWSFAGGGRFNADTHIDNFQFISGGGGPVAQAATLDVASASLTALDVDTTGGGSSPATGDVTRGLVSRWKLDSGFTDSVGTNDGTNNGTALVSGGKLDGAAEFQSGDYIDCGSDTSLQPGEFSFATWVYLTQTTSGTDNIQTIAAKDDNYANRMFWMTEWDGQLSVRVGSNAVTAYGPAPTLNTWQHLVVTYDGSSTFKFYVDGVLQDSNTETTLGGSGFPLTLGAESAAYRTLKNGARLDDARFYNVELTAQEVSDLHAFDGTTTTPQTATAHVAAGSLSVGDPGATPGAVSSSLVTATATATPISATATPAAVSATTYHAWTQLFPGMPTATVGAVTASAASPGTISVSVEAISGVPGAISASVGSADASLSANQSGTAQITVVSAIEAVGSLSATQIESDSAISVVVEAGLTLLSAPESGVTAGIRSVVAENATIDLLPPPATGIPGSVTAQTAPGAASFAVEAGGGTPGAVSAAAGSADFALSARSAGYDSAVVASLAPAGGILSPAGADALAGGVTAALSPAEGVVALEAATATPGEVTVTATTGSGSLTLLPSAILLGGESAVLEVASTSLSPSTVTATPGATTATTASAGATFFAPTPIPGAGVFAPVEVASGSLSFAPASVSWSQTASAAVAPAAFVVEESGAVPGTATASVGSADMALSALQTGTAAIQLVAVNAASGSLAPRATDTVAVVYADTESATLLVSAGELETTVAQFVAAQAAAAVLGVSEFDTLWGVRAVTPEVALGSLSFAPVSVQIGAVQSLAEPAEVTLAAQEAALAATVTVELLAESLSLSPESVGISVPTREIGMEAAVVQLLALESFIQLFRRLSDTGLNSIDLDATPSLEVRPSDGALALDPERSFELLDDGDTSVDL